MSRERDAADAEGRERASSGEDPHDAEASTQPEPRVRDDGLVEETASRQRLRRRGRRVSTEPVDRAWQEPDAEQRQSMENDDRLRQDRPPHWG